MNALQRLRQAREQREAPFKEEIFSLGRQARHWRERTQSAESALALLRRALLSELREQIAADMARQIQRQIGQAISEGLAGAGVKRGTFTLTLPEASLAWMTPESLENMVLNAWADQALGEARVGADKDYLEKVTRLAVAIPKHTVCVNLAELDDGNAPPQS